MMSSLTCVLYTKAHFFEYTVLLSTPQTSTSMLQLAICEMQDDLPKQNYIPRFNP